MKPVQRSEVMDIGQYELVRSHFRRRVIELKRRRRVALGSNLTVVFENHDTVLLQIQEMLRTERITRESAIAHEIETYNELVPAEGELSATIFVEYPEPVERDRMLVALDGLENHFYMEIGSERIEARSETRGVQPGKTTAVHYVKYPLTPLSQDGIRSGQPVGLGVGHPAYQVRVDVEDAVVSELRRDLSED